MKKQIKTFEQGFNETKAKAKKFEDFLSYSKDQLRDAGFLPAVISRFKRMYFLNKNKMHRELAMQE
jgi:hypothetical protein